MKKYSIATSALIIERVDSNPKKTTYQWSGSEFQVGNEMRNAMRQILPSENKYTDYVWYMVQYNTMGAGVFINCLRLH